MAESGRPLRQALNKNAPFGAFLFSGVRHGAQSDQLAISVLLDLHSSLSLSLLAEAAEPLFYRLAIYLSVSMMDDPAMLAMWFC